MPHDVTKNLYTQTIVAELARHNLIAAESSIRRLWCKRDQWDARDSLQRWFSLRRQSLRYLRKHSK